MKNTDTKTLALIHTSLVFINVETMMKDIFAQVMPEVRLINIVDDSLLADVMKVGAITPEVQKRMNHYVQAAERTGADAVFSLCSSLGPTIDEARKQVSIPVIKIDDAMAAKAANTAEKMAVMATVPTTLGPTVDLIEEKAKAAGKTLSIKRCLVEGAFQRLMEGDKAGHDALVLGEAEKLKSEVDLIVFAQASMTRLAGDAEGRSGLTVLTSPQIGIEYAREVLYA